MAATKRTLDELSGLGGAIFDQKVRPSLFPTTTASSSPLMSKPAITRSTWTTTRVGACGRGNRPPMCG